MQLVGHHWNVPDGAWKTKEVVSDSTLTVPCEISASGHYHAVAIRDHQGTTHHVDRTRVDALIEPAVWRTLRNGSRTPRGSKASSTFHHVCLNLIPGEKRPTNFRDVDGEPATMASLSSGFEQPNYPLPRHRTPRESDAPHRWVRLHVMYTHRTLSIGVHYSPKSRRPTILQRSSQPRHFWNFSNHGLTFSPKRDVTFVGTNCLLEASCSKIPTADLADLLQGAPQSALLWAQV